MFKKIIPILLALIIVNASCSDYPCTKADLRFGLVGFSDTEADTIIIRRFEKQGSGSVLKDTFLFSNIFYRSQDTLSMGGVPSTASLQPEYNYEIKIPGAARLMTITNIIEEQRFIKPSGKVGCINNIKGYTLNGQVYNNIEPFNTTYLSK